MENLEEKTERFLLGDLPENEMMAFENALKIDSDLAKSVAAHRQMMDRLEALRLRKKVKKALARTQANEVKAIPLYANRMVWSVAASLLLLAAAIWFFKQKPVPPAGEMADNPVQSTDIHQPSDTGGTQHSDKSDPDAFKAKPAENRTRLLALTRSYYTPPANSFIRDAEETNDPASPKTTTQMAAEAFETGNYTIAAEYLRSDEKVVHDETARYLRANARFHIGQFLGAATDFSALHDSFQFKHDARWNYMLCQIALGKIELAKSILKNMEAETDFPYHDKAVELLGRLNF